MATRDEAHGKRCASVRFPVLALQPVSKARKAKARPIPKLGRHSSGCLLHANTDFLDLDLGITDANGEFVHSLNTNPAFANRRLIMQHAVFEGGSFASSLFSNGLEVAF